jgi:hypothetical protein
MTFTFNKIKKSYPSYTELAVSEVFYPNTVGWATVMDTHPITFPQELEWYIKRGATQINFRLVDEFGQVRYPDFTSNELILQ